MRHNLLLQLMPDGNGRRTGNDGGGGKDVRPEPWVSNAQVRLYANDDADDPAVLLWLLWVESPDSDSDRIPPPPLPDDDDDDRQLPFSDEIDDDDGGGGGGG